MNFSIQLFRQNGFEIYEGVHRSRTRYLIVEINHVGVCQSEWTACVSLQRKTLQSKEVLKVTFKLYTLASDKCIEKLKFKTISRNLRGYLKNHWTKYRLVCTQINAFFMLNPNIAMKIWISIKSWKNLKFWPVFCTRQPRGEGYLPHVYTSMKFFKAFHSAFQE